MGVTNRGDWWMAVVIGAGCVAPGAMAADDAAAHRGWTLLDPTPRDRMRELSADRPDTTESPYTVDAGHLQIEMSLLDCSIDKRGSDQSTRTLTMAPMMLKVGLLDYLDIQLGLEPFIAEQRKDRTTGEVEHVDGFGDTVVRVKWNLWGNNGGATAGALMPYVTVPSASSDLGAARTEGGLIFPVAVDLGHGWSLGLMAEWDLVYDEDESGYRSDLLHTVVIGRELSQTVGVYLEYAGIVRLDRGGGGEDYRGAADCGGTYAVTEDVQLDAGVRVGLTPAAEDLGVFVGWTMRF